MKHKELSNFTYEDLSNFTYEQLSLDKLELLEQVSQDAQVPEEIINKLYLLCEDAMKQIKDSSICLPADKKDLALHDTLAILKFIATLPTFLKDAHSIICNLCDYFNL